MTNDERAELRKLLEEERRTRLELNHARDEMRRFQERLTAAAKANGEALEALDRFAGFPEVEPKTIEASPGMFDG